MTSEVTVTAEWLGPTSILGFSISPTASETVTSTKAPALTPGLNTTETSAAGAAAVVGDASLWLGGGGVPAPEVVAVIVSCSYILFSHPCPIQIRDLHLSMPRLPNEHTWILSRGDRELRKAPTA